jgi:hypothetical protein
MKLKLKRLFSKEPPIYQTLVNLFTLAACVKREIRTVNGNGNDLEAYLKRFSQRASYLFYTKTSFGSNQTLPISSAALPTKALRSTSSSHNILSTLSEEQVTGNLNTSDKKNGSHCYPEEK